MIPGGEAVFGLEAQGGARAYMRASTSLMA